jgi:hypothetical protein
MRLSRKLGGLLAAGMMLAGVTGAAVPASASTPPPYWQILTFAYECLQGDLGGPMGSSVTQQFCDTTGTNTHQLWLPISLGGDTWKFENVGTGLCLEARFGAVSGKPVPLWDCSSTESNTRWQWPVAANVSSFPGIHPIQSRVSGSTGYCLDVPDESTAPRLQVQLFRCNGTGAQLFWITRFP